MNRLRPHMHTHGTRLSGQTLRQHKAHRRGQECKSKFDFHRLLPLCLSDAPHMGADSDFVEHLAGQRKSYPMEVAASSFRSLAPALPSPQTSGAAPPRRSEIREHGRSAGQIRFTSSDLPDQSITTTAAYGSSTRIRNSFTRNAY